MTQWKSKIPNGFLKFWAAADKFLVTVTHFCHAMNTWIAPMVHSVSSVFCDSYTQSTLFRYDKNTHGPLDFASFANSYTL